MGKTKNFRWWIAALLFFGTALSFFDRQVLSILAPTLTKELGMNNEDYAKVVFAFVAAYTIMFTLGGRIIDWLGTRWGMLASVGVWTLGSALHALVRTPLQLGVYRFILGIGEGGCIPGVMKGTMEWFPINQRSRATGIAVSGAAVGSLLAPPVTVFLTGQIGWRGAFLATGAMGAVWLVLWYLFYQLPQKSRHVTSAELDLIVSGQEPAPTTSGSVEAKPLLPWTRLLRLREVQGLMLSRFLLDPVFYLYMFWIPKFLADERGASLADIGKLAWIPFITLDISNIFAGWASDRLVRRGYSINRARKTLMGAAAFITPISILAMYADSTAVTVLLMSVLMLAHGFWITNYMTMHGDLFPAQSVGTVVGLAGSAGGLGGMITTHLIGRIVEQYSFVPVFFAAGLMYLVGFAVIMLMIPRIERVRI